ncbi:MAG: T9SS type A sorting domain-containing protein [Ignavibacteriae bacterium]|nr:T9SS type A sorting domain-containing protein [Ignavibacteriota bacterium]
MQNLILHVRRRTILVLFLCMSVTIKLHGVQKQYLHNSTVSISRDSAIAIVTSQVINPSPYKNTLVAFLYDPPGEDSTLAAGYEVMPFDSSLSYSVTSHKWFFWLDLSGEIFYAHPCKFLFVDATSGELENYDESWWPIVIPPNESPTELWGNYDDRFSDSSSIIYGFYRGIPEPQFSESAQSRVVKLSRYEVAEENRRFKSPMSNHNVAILVGGHATKTGEENVWRNNMNMMQKALESPLPNGGSPLVDRVERKNNASIADLQDLINEFTGDPTVAIVFYYVGHGDSTSGGVMNMRDGELTYSQLAQMLNKATNVRAKIIIIEACRSGSAKNDFGSKHSIVIITTATDSAKTADSRNVYDDKNGDGRIDKGDSIRYGEGKFTKAWVNCFDALMRQYKGYPSYQRVYDCIRSGNPDSIVEKQNLIFFEQRTPVQVVQNINAPGRYQFPRTGVEVEFSSVIQPFEMIVTRYNDPTPGAINPQDTTIVALSEGGYWDFQQNPVTSVAAHIYFDYNPNLDNVPLNRLKFARRPSPSISDPDPLWNNFRPFFWGDTVIAAYNAPFSQWAFAAGNEFFSTSFIVDAKWNLVSVPMRVTDRAKTMLFPMSVSNAYHYNGNYVQQDSLENGKGYWLKFNNAQVVNVFGSSVLAETCDIVQGWNLVGSISHAIEVSSVSTIPPNIPLSSFFDYYRGYYVSNTIIPGHGYWVKADEVGKLVVDLSGYTGSNIIAKQDIFNRLNILTVTDAATNSQTLYYGRKRDFSTGIHNELPPQPPRGVFEVRFVSNKIVEVVDESTRGDFPISISSAQYPLTISWEIKQPAVEALLIVGEKGIGFTTKGAVQIPIPDRGQEDQVFQIVLRYQGSKSIPASFALKQDYPNPFNPTTIIEFDLPEVSIVSMKVHDLLGREITTLRNNEQLEAGTHQVTFDASGLPSGVYIYRIVAQSMKPDGELFQSVKKMVLLR